MKLSRNFRLKLLLLVTLLSSLACRTLLGDPPGSLSPTEAVSVATLPPRTVLSPTEAPASPRNLLRLDGQHLPNLVIGSPGISPNDRDRPQLSGDPQTLDTEHFRIHYTLNGNDAVPPQDTSGNGHPDYVEDVAQALEYSWFAEIEHFGWAQPPGDAGLGGDDRLDVYLQKIFDDGNAGYVESDYSGGSYGDNPNTSRIESAASSSFMVLDNDYDGYADSPVAGVSLLEYIQSTVAHEFAHIIQYGYDAEEPHDWLWEATATWIQDEVFDLVNDGNEYLSGVFKAPDSCQLTFGGEKRVEDTDHWYGLWIFLRFLSEQYGHDSVRLLWEHAIDADGYEAWDRMLAQQGTSLEDLMRAFSVALLTRDFEEGPNYPVVRLEGAVRSSEAFAPADGVAQMGVDFIEILADEPVEVVLVTNELEGLLVAILGGQANLLPLQGGGAQLDASQYEHTYLLVINLHRARSEAGCGFSDYSVLINPAAAGQAPASSQPAPNFQPPRVENLKAPDHDFDN